MSKREPSIDPKVTVRAAIVTAIVASSLVIGLGVFVEQMTEGQRLVFALSQTFLSTGVGILIGKHI